MDSFPQAEAMARIEDSLGEAFGCGAGCGADVVVNTEEQMGARCHWCRHVLTINEQVPNGAVPDAVLPFSIRMFTNAALRRRSPAAVSGRHGGGSPCKKPRLWLLP